MKIITKSLAIMLMIVGISLLVQCQKDEISPTAIDQPITDANNKKFNVNNDIIEFATLEDFKKTIEELTSVSDLATWEKDHGIQKSMRSFQDDLDTPTEELIIPDDQFATLVNKDGLIIIGDKIHLITFEKEYTLPLKVHLSNLSMNSFMTEGTHFPIQRKLSSTNSNLKFGGWREVFQDTNNNGGDDTKVKLSGWNVTYVLYASIGIRIKNYIGGSLSRMDYGKVYGTAHWSLNGGDWFDTTDWEEGTNKKKIAKTLVWVAGTGVFLDCDNIVTRYDWEDDFAGSIGSATWNVTWN